MRSAVATYSVEMDPFSAAWQPGCQSRAALPTTQPEPRLPGHAVLKHVRDAASRTFDTNVGWWQIVDLEPTESFEFSCDVYIPRAFAGRTVRLCAGRPLDITVDADLTRRDEWQQLSLTATLPPGVSTLHLVLRVVSDTETVVYSSAWRVDQVAGATTGAGAARRVGTAAAVGDSGQFVHTRRHLESQIPGPARSRAQPEITELKTMDPYAADSFPGCQSTPAAPAGEVDPPLPGAVVLRHLRDAAARVYDSNVSWWELNRLEPGELYVFACWVYLPQLFRGTEVALHLGAPLHKAVRADASRREEWQQLKIEAVIPEGISDIALVLRVQSDPDTLVYSSCWTVGQLMTRADTPPQVGASGAVFNSRGRELIHLHAVSDFADEAWHAGCQSLPAAVTNEVPAPQPGMAVIKHVRDAAERTFDTNLAWWFLKDLRGGRRYAASCSLYVPRSAPPGEAWLHLGHPLEGRADAAWSKRDQWQVLSVTFVPSDDLPELAVVLRAAAGSEATLYSAAWSLREQSDESDRDRAAPQPLAPTRPTLTLAPTADTFIAPFRPDLATSELMMRFESLGENCEFGLVQRRCGAEPLGLFRFANAPLVPLVAALNAHFEGLGAATELEVFLSELEEYIVRDKRFGFVYHAWVRAGEMAPEQIHQREIKRLPFLIRKLVEDLAAAEKIFVYHGMDPLSEQQVLPLLRVLQTYGPNTLLWAVLADAAHPPGTAEWVMPGLIKGYMDRFAPGENAHDLSLDCWVATCRAAHLLWHAGYGAGGDAQPATLSAPAQ